MAKYLKRIECAISEDFTGISREVYSVVDMFVFYLKNNIRTENISKLYVFFTNELKENNVVLDVEYFYDNFTNYLKILKSEEINSKRKLFLDNIVTIIRSRVEDKVWVEQNLDSVLQVLKDKEYVFSDFYKSKVLSSDKKRKATLFFEYKSTLKIYLSILDKKNNVLLKKKILDVIPAPSGVMDLLKLYLKSIKWTDNDEVVISHSNNRDYWLYDLSKNKLEFHYSRAEKNDPHGQYDLALMYFNGQGVLKDEEKGMYWLQKSANQGFKRAKKMLGSRSGNGAN